MKALLAQLVRFGAVGAVGFLVDVSVFNILRITVFSPENLHEGPVVAKVISTVVAIAVNWVGNRYWTFGPHRRPQALREGIEFAVVSVGGMFIGLACLWLSHYVLGYTSLLADNISSNVIGLAIGTAFRFWLYRTWVFRPARNSSAPSRTTEGAVLPAGFTPAHRIQAVAPIDDGAVGND
ncbi:MAG: GtrA family protein [Cryobacterium sp.]|nr:GtrA family protein [Cryobacterium sp.]